MTKTQSMSYRYELKMPLRSVPEASVLSVIRAHPAGFEEVYPRRQVNNLYFDTPELDCLWISLSGMSDRVKQRLRWYGASSAVGEGQFEWKLRKGRLGSKDIAPVQWQGALPEQRWSSLSRSFRADLTGAQRERFDQHPRLSLLNSYSRCYFQSRRHGCRLTFDTCLRFAPVKSQLRARAGRLIEIKGLSVLELKVAQGQEQAAGELLQGFPFRVARFSKYGTGLERLA